MTQWEKMAAIVAQEGWHSYLEIHPLNYALVEVTCENGYFKMREIQQAQVMPDEWKEYQRYYIIDPLPGIRAYGTFDGCEWWRYNGVIENV